MNDYVITILATGVIYLFVIFAIIIFGKKELSQLSIIDLVFILLISNSVQDAMVSGKWEKLLTGIVAASTLFILNYVLKRLIYKSETLRKLIEGSAVELIVNGKVNEEDLVNERISVHELEEAIREHGVESIEEVKLAVLETDGSISVISNTNDKKTIILRKRKKIIPKFKRGS